MADLRYINPETIAPPPGRGFTHVVEATGPGRTIYIAGQLGVDLSGKLAGGVGDFRAQTVQAFENLKAALASVGAGFQHVVKLNSYLVGIEHLPVLREVRGAYLNKAAPPASTTVGISELALSGALFEIEAIAVLPPA